jgi:hypothetical protein
MHRGETMAGFMSGRVRERLSAGLALCLGGMLGGAMIVSGLMDRVIGRYPSTLSHYLGMAAWLNLGMPRGTITWLLLCVGLLWWGTVCAFAYRPRWGWMVVIAVAIPTLLLAPIGTVASLIVLCIAAGSRFFGGAASS